LDDFTDFLLMISLVFIDDYTGLIADFAEWMVYDVIQRYEKIGEINPNR